MEKVMSQTVYVPVSPGSKYHGEYSLFTIKFLCSKDAVSGWIQVGAVIFASMTSDDADDFLKLTGEYPSRSRFVGVVQMDPDRDMTSYVAMDGRFIEIAGYVGRPWFFLFPSEEAKETYGATCQRCGEYNEHAIMVPGFTCYSCSRGL